MNGGSMRGCRPGGRWEAQRQHREAERIWEAGPGPPAQDPGPCRLKPCRERPSLSPDSPPLPAAPLEADLATSHGVAQLGLVVDERHEPHVGLDEQRPLQHQHTRGLATRWAFLLGFLHSLDQQRLEAVQLEVSARQCHPRERKLHPTGVP